MKFSTTLLPLLAGIVGAADHAKVYILDDAPQTSTHYPTLSPEVARLIFAQRMDASSYHSLEHADEATLEYINAYGGKHQTLFSDAPKDESRQLLLVVEGVTDRVAEGFKEAEKSDIGLKAAFEISNPPSSKANGQLIEDLRHQRSPDSRESKHIQIGHFQPEDLKKTLLEHKKDWSSVMIVLFPESSRFSKSPSNPYGSYEVAPKLSRRQQFQEEPIPGVEFDFDAASNIVVPGAAYSPAESAATKLPKVIPACFSSMDTCVSSTNNCSGHGNCYQKYSDGDRTCFACTCVPTYEEYGKNGSFTLTYWGGGACSKIDVSSPFWLIAGFTVTMVFLVGWAIGMLFSVGEEKLPGVIGAGVSGAKPR